MYEELYHVISPLLAILQTMFAVKISMLAASILDAGRSKVMKHYSSVQEMGWAPVRSEEFHQRILNRRPITGILEVSDFWISLVQSAIKKLKCVQLETTNGNTRLPVYLGASSFLEHSYDIV